MGVWLLGIVAFWLTAQLVYPALTVALARMFGRDLPVKDTNVEADIACIITAYKNVEIARPLVESLLKQRYSRFCVYLVADECPAPEFGFDDERLTVLRPDPPLRLKVRSIIHAVSHFRRKHEYIAVFDADNVTHPDFLKETNRYLQQGYRCVQGRRTAKNTDTGYAGADGIGESYKNYIERYVPWLLNGSAVISGSGMTTAYDEYVGYLNSPEISQGNLKGKRMLQEDKILQNYLVRRGVQIAYARRAIVFDEKTETAKGVETQRSRWLYSYFQNVPNALRIAWDGLVGGFDLRMLYFAWVTLALPLFIQLGLSVLTAAIAWFVTPVWTYILMSALILFAGNTLLVLRLDGAPGSLWRSVARVPSFFWLQFKSLLKMRNPDKYFAHTEHRRVLRVDELAERSDAPDAQK